MDKRLRIFLENGLELDVNMPRFDRGEMNKVKKMLDGIEIDGLVFPDGRVWKKIR